MLSNLVNDSAPQNSTKSRSLQNVSDAAKNNSASKEPSTDRIWKCNIDAMVNNTGKQLYTSKISLQMSLKLATGASKNICMFDYRHSQLSGV